MRTIHLAAVMLIVGVAALLIEGGPQSRLVPWGQFGMAEAGSGQVSEGSTAEPSHEANARDLEAEAEAYDAEADKIQAQVMKYKREAAAITPLMDTKGFRRSALLMAAASQARAVAELRQLAAHHRAEAKRMLAKAQAQ